MLEIISSRVGCCYKEVQVDCLYAWSTTTSRVDAGRILRMCAMGLAAGLGRSAERHRSFFLACC